jgi:hypothetical protein
MKLQRALEVMLEIIEIILHKNIMLYKNQS